MNHYVELNKIYNEDCLEGMKRMASKSIDMILCDLPYGTTHFEWDKRLPLEALFVAYNRIIKDNGVIALTAQQPFTTDLINAYRQYFRYEIIWEKTQKLGFPNANRMPLRGHENILIFYKRLPVYNPQKYETGKPTNRVGDNRENRYNGYGKLKANGYKRTNERHPHSVIKISNWNGCIFGRKLSGATKHPTQKPVELFRWLIRSYTNEGMIVLDNCMGSGTTAEACVLESRSFIGFETCKEYYEYSIERLGKTGLK